MSGLFSKIFQGKKQKQQTVRPMPNIITQVQRDDPQNKPNDDDNSNKKSKKNLLSYICSCLTDRNSQVQEQIIQTYEIDIERSGSVRKQSGYLPDMIEGDKRKTLLLDLDETLVHSSFTQVKDPDFTINGMPFVVYVKKRPGAEIFLEEMGKFYELVVFTASLAEVQYYIKNYLKYFFFQYADPVIDLIDLKKSVQHRLFRDSCTFQDGIFVKDLSLMGRELKDMIIVDNSENSFMFQPANAIHIKSYFDDTTDGQLFQLVPFLRFIQQNMDVRHVGDQMNYFYQHDNIEIINNKGEKVIYNQHSYQDTIDSSSVKSTTSHQRKKSDEFNIEQEEENTDRILIHKNDESKKSNYSNSKYQQEKINKQQKFERSSYSNDFLVNKDLNEDFEQQVQNNEGGAYDQENQENEDIEDINPEKVQISDSRSVKLQKKDPQNHFVINNSNNQKSNKKLTIVKKKNIEIQIPESQEGEPEKIQSTTKLINVEDLKNNINSPRINTLNKDYQAHQSLPHGNQPQEAVNDLNQGSINQSFDHVRYDPNSGTNFNSPVAIVNQQIDIQKDQKN